MDELVVEVEVVLDEDEVLEGRSRVCCEDLEQTPPDREKCERKRALAQQNSQDSQGLEDTTP